MSKSNATEADLIAYTFNATAIPWAAATIFTVHLHTADPGEGGNSSTNETAYTNYVPVDVNRNSGGWTCVDNQASNAALIQFAQCGASGATITHVSITPKSSTQILYSGALNAPLSVANLIQPQFAIGALIVQED